MRGKSVFADLDWLLVGLYLLLVLMGWINIYAANYQPDHPSIFDGSMEYGKQFKWILGAVVLIFILLLLDTGFIVNTSQLVYLATVVLLVLVLWVGKEVNGAKSWFGIGSFGIQPSEFAKFGTALMLARYLSLPNIKLYQRSVKMRAYLLIMVPAALIALQPDMGTVLVFGAFIFTLYREGLSGNILLLGLLAIVVSVISLLIKPLEVQFLLNDPIPAQFILLGVILVVGLLAIWGIRLFVYPRYRKGKVRLVLFGLISSLVLAYSVDQVFERVLDDHQKTRVNILLGLDEDPLGAGYNVNQSKTAIGSGQFAGKGFLKGQLTKYKYVPMQSTDFIFCTVGEEWGFVGSAILIIIFVTFFIRMVQIAERQKQAFVRIYAYSVVSILFFHFMINIGMTLGLAPVIGIPLPFFSYGGSSLWAFTMMVFVLIKLDAERVHVLS